MIQNSVFVCGVVLLSLQEKFVSAQEYATASVSNETADYFFLQDSSSNISIVCPASKGCFIHCAVADSCRDATITSSSESPSWLHLQCDVMSACSQMTVLVAATQSANIVCSGGAMIGWEQGACSNADVVLSGTPNVHVHCDNVYDFFNIDGVCEGLNLVAENVTSFTLDCIEYYACINSEIFVNAAETATINDHFVVNCAGSNSCSYSNIDSSSGGDLVVDCADDYSCSYSNMSLHSAGSLTINAGNSDALYDANVDASSGGDLAIACGSSYACRNANIRMHMDAPGSMAFTQGGYNAVEGATIIWPAVQPTELNYSCIGSSSCSGLSLEFAAAATESVNIVCSGGSYDLGQGACGNSTIVLADTPNVYVRCDGGSGYDVGPCGGLNLLAENVTSFTLDCSDQNACETSEISINAAETATINAYGSYALGDAIIINSSSDGDLLIDCASSSCYYSNMSLHSAGSLTINAGGSYALADATLTLSASTAELDLTCSGSDSCRSLSIETAPTQSARIACLQGSACQDARFLLSTTPTVTLMCGYADEDDAVCGGLTLDVSNTANFSMFVNGTYALYQATIYPPSGKPFYLDCHSNHMCGGTHILSTSTMLAPTELYLNCTAEDSCADMVIDSAPTQSASIVCSNQAACRGADLSLATTPVVSLLCESNLDGACNALTLNASQTENLTIDLNGNYSLANAFIYAQNANQLFIDCNAPHSCASLSVFPPYHSEYAFNLVCSQFEASCANLSINVPSVAGTAVADDYMQLDCPRYNVLQSCDGISWTCVDQSLNASVTPLTFSDALGLYVCSSEECCPWTDLGVAQQPEPRPLINAVAPSSVQSDGEYYIFIGEDSPMYQAVNCLNSTACYIYCAQPFACQYMLIYAAHVSYLEIVCSGEYACYGMYVIQGPIDGEAYVECASDSRACFGTTFRMQDTSTVSVDCGDCHYMRLFASDADSVSLTCNEAFDCMFVQVYVESVTTVAQIMAAELNALYNAMIYAMDAAQLNVTCLADACSFVDVYAPYSTPYNFALNCVGSDACSYVKVFVPDRNVTADNYMQLVCPTESTADCDVAFRCQTDLTETDTTYDADAGRVWCASDACCPWTDFAHREAQSNEPGTTASTATMTTTAISPGESGPITTATETITTAISAALPTTETMTTTAISATLPANETIATTSIASGLSTAVPLESMSTTEVSGAYASRVVLIFVLCAIVTNLNVHIYL